VTWLTLQAVLAKIKSKTRGHIVYPGLEVFKDKKPDQEIHLQKQDVPGLKETGWDPAVDAL
jgi:histone acetyltransferase